MAFRQAAVRQVAGLVWLVLLLPAAAVADQWDRFRGPNGSGVSSSSLPADWEQCEFAWRQRLPGVGHSSPVAWGTMLLVASGDEQTGERILECRDTRTGQVRWTNRVAAPTHRKHKLNSYASSTPAVDHRHIYWSWTTDQQHLVLAVDHQGREVWRTDLGPYDAGHGSGASPIVYQDLVVIPSEHNGDSAWYALDGADGTIRWKVARDSKYHYATPCVFAPAGQPASLVFSNWEYGITAVDPLRGQIRWQADVFDKGHFESSIGSPVVAGNLVLGVCGYLGYGNELIAVAPGLKPGSANGPPGAPDAQPAPDSLRDGAGDPPRTAARAWRLQRGMPLCTTPVVKDDLVFAWSDNGIVTCAEVASGDVVWQQRVGGTYYASPICLHDRLLNVSADGELLVLDAGRAYRLAGRRKLDEPSHSTPAVADGRLYLRTFSQLFALPLVEHP